MNRSTPLADQLRHAAQVARDLIARNCTLNNIVFLPSGGLVIQLRRASASLQGHCYAWGVDGRGRWERHATRLDGVQVVWEIR